MTPEESTTPDLVELVRQGFFSTGGRDFDGWMSLFAADAVWDTSQAGVGIFEGAAAIRSFAEDWAAAYDEWEAEWEEVQDLGNGVVFGVNRQDARLAGSKSKVRERYGLTLTFNAAGLIVRLDANQDIDTARAAAERLAEERADA
jgi:ketosteroid isomerase-like protein